MIRGFPFTIFPLVIYNLLAFAFGFATDADWAGGIFSVPMFSGESWTLTAGALLILVSLVFLFFEVLRATVARGAMVNHMASVIVLIVMIIEFVVVRQCATSVFFILTAIAIFDVLAGPAITIRMASRDVQINPDGGY
jgi:hypothetical protein